MLFWLIVSIQGHAAEFSSGKKSQQVGIATVIGPMTGAVTQKSAHIWAQIEKAPRQETAEVWIEYRAKAGHVANGRSTQSSARVPASAENHWTAKWVLDQLEPGADYEYQVKWKSPSARGASEISVFKTESLWQYRSDPPSIRLIAGSCAYTNDPAADRPGQPYGRSSRIYRSMAARQPDLTLWMGDNIYFREPDFGDQTAMGQRYDKWRSLPDLQPLLRTGSHLATWDDHDYGPNDSNASYVHKSTSLKLFQRYWTNPSYGLPGQPGVFTHHAMSDVEFFILDDRWYRDSDKLLDDGKQMLGTEQMSWLKNSLLASNATWKFIVSGSQVLNLNNRFEGWHRFQNESQNFFQWLENQKIPGVIFLSGDRHFSVLLKLERGANYPIYELTCSPLTAGTYDNPVQDITSNSRVVAGTVVTKNNFCEIEITGTRNDRRLSASVRDINGDAQWTRTIHETELR